MDNILTRIPDFIKRYRYAILIVIIGLVLMAIPEKKDSDKTNPQEETIVQADTEEKLESILREIQGAGFVKVLLTESRGAEIEFQTNSDSGEGSVRKDTVLISNRDHEEKGLIRRKNPPIWQGAIVVCQGAENASVKLAIVEAVSCVTGLGANKISVIKMK